MWTAVKDKKNRDLKIWSILNLGIESYESLLNSNNYYFSKKTEPQLFMVYFYTN